MNKRAERIIGWVDKRRVLREMQCSRREEEEGMGQARDG